MNAKRNQLRAERIANGLCRDCGEPNQTDYVCCPPCRNKELGTRSRYYSQTHNKERKLRIDRQGHKRNRPSRLIEQRARNLAIKTQVIEGYGGRCSCCHEKELVFLTIDHIHGDGAQRRRDGKEPKGGAELYRWILKNSFPDHLQVLCYNCNCAKRDGDVCPHQLQGK